jgi:hypothetical protein
MHRVRVRARVRHAPSAGGGRTACGRRGSGRVRLSKNQARRSRLIFSRTSRAVAVPRPQASIALSCSAARASAKLRFLRSPPSCSPSRCGGTTLQRARADLTVLQADRTRTGPLVQVRSDALKRRHAAMRVSDLQTRRVQQRGAGATRIVGGARRVPPIALPRSAFAPLTPHPYRRHRARSKGLLCAVALLTAGHASQVGWSRARRTTNALYSKCSSVQPCSGARSTWPLVGGWLVQPFCMAL